MREFAPLVSGSILTTRSLVCPDNDRAPLDISLTTWVEPAGMMIEAHRVVIVRLPLSERTCTVDES
jgi:hypothetical protein